MVTQPPVQGNRVCPQVYASFLGTETSAPAEPRAVGTGSLLCDGGTRDRERGPLPSPQASAPGTETMSSIGPRLRSHTTPRPAWGHQAAAPPESRRPSPDPTSTTLTEGLPAATYSQAPHGSSPFSTPWGSTAAFPPWQGPHWLHLQPRERSGALHPAGRSGARAGAQAVALRAAGDPCSWHL